LDFLFGNVSGLGCVFEYAFHAELVLTTLMPTIDLVGVGLMLLRSDGGSKGIETASWIMTQIGACSTLKGV